jgi:hypothetical protein
MLTDSRIKDLREEENEELGDSNGRLAGHEERIRVLEGNQDALDLELYHIAEEAAGLPRSDWNEETGQWGELIEADYEAEEGPELSDMDISDDDDDD